MRSVLAALMLLAAALPALAVNPSEMLGDPALEARARAISADLRCLVCQNQSIEDSDADLASELRVLVRERITAGDSDAEVTQFVVDRYGEYVLLRPVVGWHTVALWGMAPLLLVVGGVAIVMATRRRRPAPGPTDLSPEERAAIEDLKRDPAAR